jgi:hypothetical protein
MTGLDNEIRELDIDKLDPVSGGLLWWIPGDRAPIATAATTHRVGQLIRGYPKSPD